ncbi:hypothetical protein PsalMR5_04690 (plasmid) [Piscirickettsia salmonis]|nr:hypothetical protein PsalSR1_04721 [Piscirickettsia salmonis]QGP62089.1 hypothetical protein PsalBI1_04731 [Piscirickettsia salmonis]QGP66765.1 hypothetical protein PsalMR5_04690 [Piscirickettsia salmonis]
MKTTEKVDEKRINIPVKTRDSLKTVIYNLEKTIQELKNITKLSKN